MRHGRFITTALVATAAMAIGPAWASAAPSPLVDDAQSDFAAAGPQTGTWAVEPGQVRLKLGTVAENFDGTTLPAGFESVGWPNGQGPVVQTPAPPRCLGVNSPSTAPASTQPRPPSFVAPQTLEFRAAFGADEFENMGFGDTFDNGPWAAFSTSPTPTPGTFFARTNTAALNGTQMDTAIPVGPSFSPADPHLYRIEWAANDVKFFIDGLQVADHVTTIASPMRPIVSDLNSAAGGPVVKSDWLTSGAVPSSGTFTSRVLSADSAHTVWGNLTSASTGTTFETQTGNTPTPDTSWSHFQAVGAGGAIQSPSGQYIQYRATLTGAAASIDSASLVLHGRQRGAERGDRIGRRERHLGQRLVLEPRQRHRGLPVQPRRWRLRRLLEPQGVHRPRGRRAHGGRAADRQGGQCRPDRVADVQHRQPAVRGRRRAPAVATASRPTPTRPRRR